MAKRSLLHLSRRERQIMDVVYARGQVTVGQVQGEMADPPSYTSVRALMRILEEKGHLKHKRRGVRYLYAPTRARGQAAKAAMRNLLQTFFDGSAEKAVATLLGVADSKLTKAEFDRLHVLIDKARKPTR